jgi:hypothetical protein
LLKLAEPHRKCAPGRPPGYDWGSVGEFVGELLDYHGDFRRDDPRWNCMARLKDAVLDKMVEMYGDEPAESTVKKRIGPMVDEWRQRKADKSA